MSTRLAVHVNYEESQQYITTSSSSAAAESPLVMTAGTNGHSTNGKHSKNRKRFDSSSTNCSSLESCQQFDNRFEAKLICEVPKVKKSFLSTPDAQKQNGSPLKAHKSALSSSSSSSTAFSSTATTQYASLSAECFSIVLCILNPNERDAYNNYVFRCFPPVEMVLDDEKSVDALLYEITANLNDKLHAQLMARYPQVNISTQHLLKINATSMLNGDFELSEASKNGQPKGCSFDLNQPLRKIKCKPRLSLKVFSETAYEAVLLQLLKKQTNNKYGQGVNTIIEAEDESISVVRGASLYKESIMQREMDSHRDSLVLSKQSYSGLSFAGKENLNLKKSNSDSTPSPAAEKKPTEPKLKQKKRSFWSRIFKCNQPEMV